MAFHLGALRDALAEVGVSHEAAARASEELAGYETWFTDLNRDMVAGFAHTERKISKLAREVVARFAGTDQKISEVARNVDAIRQDRGRVLDHEMDARVCARHPRSYRVPRVHALRRGGSRANTET